LADNVKKKIKYLYKIFTSTNSKKSLIWDPRFSLRCCKYFGMWCYIVGRAVNLWSHC